LVGPRPQQPFDDHVNRPIRRLGHLSDRGDRADPAQLARFGTVILAILKRQKEQAVGGQRPIDGFDRRGPVDGERLQR
jgi:hypothetical protein